MSELRALTGEQGVAMQREQFLAELAAQADELKRDGLYKRERQLASPQAVAVRLADGREVVNFCANNYLGLADDPRLIAAARQGLEQHGFGMASVRFICGTQDIHAQLEARLAAFLGMQASILYSSCFDANGGLFEALLGPEDVVISDALNHASIIDGLRLCKAQRLRYANNNMAELEQQLQQTQQCRVRLIATDGVFSMDGVIANLPAICELAERYEALVMVDDSHAVGCVGAQGRGSHEYHGVTERIDILTGTFGKALGGASGGYTAARREIVDWLRQRSRPYLFSNSLAPPIVQATLQALDLVEQGEALRRQLDANAKRFRQGLEAAGFTLAGAGHPIVPVMIGDATLANRMAERLLEEGIYVIGFCYPVVPLGQARIRTQLSAAHTPAQLERAIAAFGRIGRELGIV